MAVGVNVDNVSFGTIGDDRVVETHSGHGTVEGRDYLFPTCSVYTIRDGKIAHVQVYTADQHGVDDFFWKANALKPHPGPARVARRSGRQRGTSVQLAAQPAPPGGLRGEP